MVVDEESGETIEVHEDFKAYMDAYEDFFDEYAEIMRDGVRLGLITVIHRPGKGPDIGDGLVCDWRYQAAAVEAAARNER